MTSGTRSSAATAIVLLVALGSVIDGAGQRGGGPPGGGPPTVNPGPPDRPTSAATVPLVGWRDLETWSRDTGLAPDTEIGLGLQLTGRDGQVGAAFSVVRLRNTPNAQPKEVVMTLVPQYDPTRVRFTNAWFVATTKDSKGVKKEERLDGSGRMVTYPPAPYAPGDGPVSAHVNWTSKEFVAIAEADAVTGNLLNVAFTFRPDQLKAVNAFARRIGLPIRR